MTSVIGRVGTKMNQKKFEIVQKKIVYPGCSSTWKEFAGCCSTLHTILNYGAVVIMIAVFCRMTHLVQTCIFTPLAMFLHFICYP